MQAEITKPIDSMPKRFALGCLVSTPGALEAFAQAQDSPLPYITRHASGDWGELLATEDRAQNDWSIDNGERILSAYLLRNGTRIWIITEADRSVTTILLPEEY